MDIVGKVALVTGSSRGIGRAIALALAEAGARVAVHYANRRDLAEGVAQEIVAAGGHAMVVGGDVSQREAVKAMVARTMDELGPIDILVNNAVHYVEGVPIWEVSEKQWDRSFDVNVKGALLMAQAVIPSMQEHRSGAILNISTLGADAVMDGYAAYISSKGAINSMTRALALELAPWNIRVNALSPGHIDTAGNVRGVVKNPARHKRYRARIALGRLGRMDEIARTAAFLVSDDAGYITGQVIHAEGGITMWQGPIA